MEMKFLRKGLFGYTPSSVEEFISKVNDDFKQKSISINNENEQLRKDCEQLKENIAKQQEEQNTLLEKIAEVKDNESRLMTENADLCNRIDELSEKLNSALLDQTDYMKERQDVADVMLEARKYTENIKQKAESEYMQMQEENTKRISSESERIDSYVEDINSVCSALYALCERLNADITVKKNTFEMIQTNLNQIPKKTFFNKVQ